MQLRKKYHKDEINIKKFVRKHVSYYDYQLVYSKLIPKIKKYKGGNRIIRKLKKDANYNCRHVSEIINITFTLHKFFDKPLNTQTILLAIDINRHHWDYIYDYMKEQREKGKVIGKINKLTSRQALKEQKARGFIHVNDFEDYDRKAAHIYSNIDRDLLYPQNFSHGIFYHWRYPLSIYIGQYVYGVQGFTRTEIPMKHKVKK